MQAIKEIAPYAVSIITALITYFQVTKKCKVELKKMQKSHENEIEKLMKQHEIDIENEKEKHKLEMESRDKEHDHEMELLRLKSETAIEEKKKEIENNTTYGLVGAMFSNMVSGDITPEKIETLQKLADLTSKKQSKN